MSIEEKNLQENIQKSIQPDLLKVKNRQTLRNIFFAGAAVFVLLGVLEHMQNNTQSLFFVAVALLIVALFVQMSISSVRSDIATTVKYNVAGHCIQKYVQNYSYDLSNGLTETVYDSGNMFKNSDIYESWNYFSGTKNGYKFEVSDIHTQEEVIEQVPYEESHTDSDGHTHYETKYRDEIHHYDIFSGLLLILHTNARFKYSVRVAPNGFVSRDVKLDSPNFEKIFDVSCADSIYAHYLLTSSFMEKLVALSEFTETNIYLSFIGEQILIYISGVHIFQKPDIKDSVEQSIQEYAGNIGYVFRIIELLDFNSHHIALNE